MNFLQSLPRRNSPCDLLVCETQHQIYDNIHKCIVHHIASLLACLFQHQDIYIVGLDKGFRLEEYLDANHES